MKQKPGNYSFYYNNETESIFSVLTEKEKAILDSGAVVKSIKKGGLIFKEGDDPSGLVFLIKGSVKLFKIGVGERPQIVRLVKPLNFVGYKALFAERPHTTSAEAIENSEIIIYSKTDLSRILSENPAFSREIIKALATELGFNYNRLINLTQKHIRGRLAETLLLIRDIYGFEADGQSLKANFTRENLAHFSNMTTPNAIRTLKNFTDEKLIKTEGKRIVLLNVSALEKISEIG
ncbi:MAG: Crp/Fnr family transcriptional regulator [Bacteroidales bacterium]|nr:Crp/Fnr family transcriptional regulator [Bacteroidales bacterium]